MIHFTDFSIVFCSSKLPF